MHYIDKLFQAFQRLHSSEVFEEIGIGLATIQRHPGCIWAENRMNEEATFYFMLSLVEKK